VRRVVIVLARFLVILLVECVRAGCVLQVIFKLIFKIKLFLKVLPAKTVLRILMNVPFSYINVQQMRLVQTRPQARILVHALQHLLEMDLIAQVCFCC